MVLRDWKKLDDNVYRRRESFAGSWQFVWVDFKNHVRVSEGSESDRLSLDIVNSSVILFSGKNGREARKFLMNYMREN